MDKYHIYEEIGKGEFSQVFKGREKKKIEYVAIKRIEKSMMSKVVSEVQVMHKLSCAHMLKFHDWYETRNNLWLILEYCTGGDLEALIKQDGHLPETSVRIFGLDIVAAIKYMHGEGMLHCDIRPCNFLVDEYGILKLSDFKNVRKIPKEPLGETPMGSRGTPDYMSPELFTEEGMHSYQSDFWAIGVVLYQLRRGSLPFGDENTLLPRLIENVRTLDPVHNPLPLSATAGESKSGDRNAHPPVTADLADLLQWLLEKNPANRGNWEAICAHPFWQPHNPVPPSKLPDQPAFEAYTRSLERAQSVLFENSSILEFGVKLDGSTEGIARTGSGGHGEHSHGSTPLMLPQTVDSTPIRVNHHNNRQNNTDPSTPPRDINLNTTVAASGAGVHITPERNNSGAQQAAYALANKSTARTPSNHTNITTTTATVATNNINATSNTQGPRTPPRAASTVNNNNLPSSGFVGDTAAATASAAANNIRNNNVGGNSNDEEFPVYSLLQHSSDTQVKPIVGNKAIEAVDNITYKENLPFPTISQENLTSLSPLELEQHLTVVYKFLQKTVLAAQSNTVVNTVVSGVLADRVNAISYLYSIATSAEVANVVLNSHFVYLLLKITKTNIVYSTTTRMTSTTNTAANTLVNTMNNNAYTSRVLSITTLAMMLRYATILNPPTIRMRDEHIVVTIVNLLNTASVTTNTTRERGNTANNAVDKIDVKFRRRLVAALGEVVFYISAQEDPDNSADASDRWALPSQAVDTLVDYCLKEDQDEVVKHYAVKTIENVFAQGAIEFKRRFVSVDLCVRLLELSLHGKNDVLQASAGMAAAHIVNIVLTAHHYPPSSNSANLNDTGTIKSTLNTSGRVNIRTTSNNLNSTATVTINDIFSIPSTIKSARFVSKVLEKCSLNGIVDVLKDGPAKLQQAYLNIINLVFSAPIPYPSGHNANTLDTTTVQSINATLRLPRAYFTKSTAILPILLNLSEQGALSAVRGKALLTCQLLCTHNTQFLAVLTERRLPNLLLRVLSPVFAALETNNTLNTAELSYFIKTALSMVYFMRNSVHSACNILCEQLTTLVTQPTSIYNSAYQNETTVGSAYESPVKGGASSVNLFQSARKAGAASPAKGGGAADNATGATVNTAALHANATILSAVAATASQPALRKLLYSISSTSKGGSSEVNSVHSVCSVINLLPQVHSVLDTLYSALPTTTATAGFSAVKNKHTLSPVVDNKSILSAVEEGVNAVERSCLMSLETLAQIEFSENTPASFSYLSSLLSTLLPASILLLEHKNGDTRVVVTSVLRRLVPSVLHAAVRFSTFFQEAENINEANRILQLALTMLPTLLLQVPSLLQDQAPIPQYTVRLLCDVFTVNTTISTSVVQCLISSGSVEVLVQLLKQKQDEEGEGIDSQLIVLLRTIFECNGAEHLLHNDLATSLVTTLISSVYSSMNGSVSMSSIVTGRKGDTINSTNAPDGVTNQHQTIIVLIDLLHIVLHFVLRAVSTADERDRQYNATHNTNSRAYYIQAEGYHKQVAPLRAVSPALLMIFAYVSAYLRETGSNSGNNIDNSSTHSNHSESSDANALLAYCHLLDSSSRSLGIIFDLFPDAITVQLLSKQSILLENGSIGGPNSRAVLTPRMVFADILANPQVELKARIRLLKIVAGVCRMSASMEQGAKSKEMLLSAPLNATLLTCSRASEIAANARTLRGQNVNVDDINVFVRLAVQVLDMANRL